MARAADFRSGLGLRRAGLDLAREDLAVDLDLVGIVELNLQHKGVVVAAGDDLPVPRAPVSSAVPESGTICSRPPPAAGRPRATVFACQKASVPVLPAIVPSKASIAT